MMTTYWKIITPSRFEHERRALDFIRAGLPDHEPYRAWVNFEFLASDGALYEVDLLVLTKQGFWLVEIKSRPGKVEGDAATWTWTTPEGRRFTDDNPRSLANRKAKALKSLLLAQPALKGVKLPFLEEVVFLSAPDLDCQLSPAGMNHVCLVDRPDDDPLGPRPGILSGLINRQVPGVEAVSRTEIDARTARALTRAMEQAGIRRSQKERRAGDYFLGDLLADSPTYQDRVATHAAIEGVQRRARQYLVARAASEEKRPHVQRAAEREFRLLQSLDHPHILRVFDFKVHDFGPVLLFEHAANAVRLDHYLTERAGRIGPDLRLSILRQLADAVRHAHGRRIVHRALAPQSVLVFDPDSQTPTVKVFNWQIGVRASETASGGTTHVTDLIDHQSRIYLAPEALFSPRQVSQAADIFSLGAIAFHLFAGRPPATDPLQLTQLLREHNGLELSAVLDGAGPRLCEMIRTATHPEVSSRTQSAEDFLAWLDEAEDEMTAPDSPPPIDPTQARRGDTLPGGYKVERVLGQGATGVALLSEQGGEQVVLKVARTPDDNQRLRDEAEVLGKLYSEYIVRLRGVTEMSGRVVLVLDKAGDETLAERLHREGPLSLEYLERFGDNLLQALFTLQEAGVSHRDIKPHNIAVRTGKEHAHLVLFDFSLSRAPVDNVFVGTAAYLDPFLKSRKPPQWEPSAERYAAAVTLYEAALGENIFPRWGDGSDPAAVPGAELKLAEESFDQAVREGLAAFFGKALHRQVKSRYHNAQEMLRAWRGVFLQAETRTVRTTEGDEVAVEVNLEEVRPETSVELLGLSTRARNALTRVNVTNVRELLGYPPRDFNFMSGVGNKTRREIVQLVGRLRERFPDITAVVTAPPAVSEDVAMLGLAALRERLIGNEPSGARRKGDGERRIRLALLGLKPAEDGLHWPTQSDVAARLAVSRQRVSQALTADRRRWGRDPAVKALRGQLVEQVRQSGGVMAARELIDFLVASRGFDHADQVHAPRLASALLRIIYEAEQLHAEPQLHLSRSGEAFVLAVSPDLAEYAVRLAAAAEAIAAEDSLPSAKRALQRLYDVPAPQLPADCTALTSERLLRLAVAVSPVVALSPRQEIYRRGMPAARALRLGLGALTGLAPGDAIKAEEVRQRIASRYPEAEPLPDPPELDTLLQEVGLDLTWDATSTCYRRPGAASPFSSDGSSLPSRLATATGSRRPQGTPEAADASNFEERLEGALRHGQFLVLTVRPPWLGRCEAELLARFPTLRRVSLDALFLGHLRRLADAEGIDWQVVLEADTVPGSEDWQYLQVLVRRAVPLARDELLASSCPVLLVHPGLLSRYRQMNLVEQVRDQVGRPGRCPGLWLLVPGDDQQSMPTLDGQALPILGAGQHAGVALAWLRNAHRGEAC